jgi:hypothetical protein
MNCDIPLTSDSVLSICHYRVPNGGADEMGLVQILSLEPCRRRSIIKDRLGHEAEVDLLRFLTN